MTLHVAHSVTDSNADSFQAQFDAFEEKYGCEIEVERLSSDADEDVYKRQCYNRYKIILQDKHMKKG